MSKIGIVIWSLGALLALNSLLFLMPVPAGSGVGRWILDFFVSASFYWVFLWVVVGLWRLLRKILSS